jgi:hypothetical protein
LIIVSENPNSDKRQNERAASPLPPAVTRKRSESSCDAGCYITKCPCSLYLHTFLHPVRWIHLTRWIDYCVQCLWCYSQCVETYVTFFWAIICTKVRRISVGQCPTVCLTLNGWCR